MPRSLPGILPSEGRLVDVTFEGLLKSGVTVSSVTCSISVDATSTNTDATPADMLVGSCALDADGVIVRQQVGPRSPSASNAGVNYLLRFEATCSDAEVLDIEVLLPVVAEL